MDIVRGMEGGWREELIHITKLLKKNKKFIISILKSTTSKLSNIIRKIKKNTTIKEYTHKQKQFNIKTYVYEPLDRLDIEKIITREIQKFIF